MPKSITAVQLAHFTAEVAEATQDAPKHVRYGIRIALLADRINRHIAEPEVEVKKGKPVFKPGKPNRKGVPGHAQSLETRMKISRGLHRYHGSEHKPCDHLPEDVSGLER